MTFYFYDLETSSGSPRGGRIMQFAGQRTNDLLEPIGEPDNILVKLADDIIPEPDAILVHGITPQQTLQEGISEAKFAAYFHDKVAEPRTIFVGFNNIRFDDEFMRYMCYRTFYDPYQWHWKDGRGRWDLLDAFRMMRALRPDGLIWPMTAEGKPTVKLEELAKVNKVVHENAHDALSDVLALIELARKFKQAQPKLFEYLLLARDKKHVARLVESGDPFVYTSGKYDSEFEKTTLVKSVLKHPRREAAIVYDLRFDPARWINKPIEELVKHWSVRYGDELEPLPVKTLQYNRCPAIAPLTVLNEASKERIGYTDAFLRHSALIDEHPAFIQKLQEALDILEHKQQMTLLPEPNVDSQLYDGFWTPQDQGEMINIRMSAPNLLSELQSTIKNKRLREMIPLYKARNYQALLTPEEHEQWESHRRVSFFRGGEKSVISKVSKRLEEIVKTRKLTKRDDYLLSELQLYIESILPEPEDSN
ncbi:MAG TPA: exodeoxyribonuclease I [Candidatus Saccharibacteria bacterium]|nr:exodeoxyribonuclease I [Candidatus Saccharibacteria bacterium]